MSIPRRAFLAMVGLLGVTSLATIGLSGFVFFRDDLSARLIARQIENQYAYEDRIAALRTHVDRLASRQMLDQDSVEARVAELMSRQAQIETRSALVAMLAQSASDTPAARKSMPAAATGATPALPAPPPAQATAFAPLAPKPLPGFEPLRGSDEPLKRRVSALGQSMTAIERQQVRALDRIASEARAKAQRLRTVLTEVGVDPERVTRAAPAPGGVGGPLAPIGEADPASFEIALTRAKAIVQAEQNLTRASRALPLRHPLGRGTDVTSSFGVRSDPFTRGYAMHTGVDFRADQGAAVRATGAGVVAKAEYSGGYGNMVEIDHGNGMTTRYAHLSLILAAEGQRVDAGAIIGRVGSTGRSTGAHLHYETRVAGDATDPAKLLAIGGRYQDLF